MEIDFGYEQIGNGEAAGSAGGAGDGSQKTDLGTGKIDHGANGVSIDDIDEHSGNGGNGDINIEDKSHNSNDAVNTNGNQKGNNDGNKGETGDDNKDNEPLQAGTVIEVGEKKYTIDANGNLVDKDNNIFKEAKDVKAWLEEFDKVEDADENTISISSIQKAIGIEITDDNDKVIEYDNTPEGITNYINAVIETAKEEQQEIAINTLYQRYPILNDVLNYYIANGNSLKGFGEIPDRSGITINDSDEKQQEAIIRTAWKEQNRKGDVESYIGYLKSSGTLLATAKEELTGLQEADAQYRKQLEEEAERKENERIENLKKYWDGVHDVIKTRQIAGYQIPEQIVVNRDGQKLSVTPEDFFNYIYRVDQTGHSAYERDLAKQTPESRRDDEILRAYLMFVGGNYSNLVNMAINKEKVATLKLRAKERNGSTVKITKPNTTVNKASNIDLGYN